MHSRLGHSFYNILNSNEKSDLIALVTWLNAVSILFILYKQYSAISKTKWVVNIIPWCTSFHGAFVFDPIVGSFTALVCPENLLLNQ